MTTEEENELDRVYKALWALYTASPVWESNYRKFIRQDAETRFIWWQRFKRQAEAGAAAPQVLLTKVIQLRLTS